MFHTSADQEYNRDCMMDYARDGYAVDDPNDEPVCVCAEYEGATPVFCLACNMWTDDAELLKAEAIEAPRKPMAIASAPVPAKPNYAGARYASIGNGLWVRTASPKKNKRGRR